MKSLLIVLAAVLGGFVAGIFLSEVIGILGVLAFQRAVGIKYLPVYLALLSGGAALLYAAWAAARGRR